NALLEVGKILSQKKDAIDNFYCSLIEVQVDKKSSRLNQMKQLFEVIVSDRRGASRDRAEIAIKDFNRIILSLIQEVDGLLLNGEYETAYTKLFESMCEKIKNVNQKIVNVYLKLVVIYLDVWQELLPFLYVPIDTWVIQMITKHLEIGKMPFSGDNTGLGSFYTKKGEKTKKYNEYLDFQNELKQVAKQINEHRIIFDGLWFIGYAFHRKYPVCGNCWVHNICVSKR
ncbi:MAG TPA: hypothetical protein VMT04_06195, partial [Terriglobales bacterium]|nr:hypothetical protein [Terriglobales bacterium]